MSEERNIEKQLRAAVEQRRKDAGGKFELHPATRRLLHGEISRLRPTASRARAGWAGNFWPRLVWGGALFAVLAIGVWQYVDSQRPKNITVAENKPVRRLGESAGYVQSAPVPAPVMAKPAPPAESVFAGSSVATAAAELPAAKSAQPILAARLNPEASARAQMLASKDRAAEKSEMLAFDRNAPVPVAAPAVSGALIAPGAVAQRQVLNFSNGVATGGAGNIVTTKKAFQQELAKSVAAANVLGSFQLEQNGDQVRIVDQDGSVYQGRLLAAARDEAALGRRDSFQNLGEIVTNGLKQSEAELNVGVAQNFRFAVSGTNLSLRQRVTVNGQFLAATNVANFVGANQVSNQQLKSKVQSGVWLSNGRVVGQAVTADGQQVNLDAQEVRLK